MIWIPWGNLIFTATSTPPTAQGQLHRIETLLVRWIELKSFRSHVNILAFWSWFSVAAVSTLHKFILTFTHSFTLSLRPVSLWCLHKDSNCSLSCGHLRNALWCYLYPQLGSMRRQWLSASDGDAFVFVLHSYLITDPFLIMLEDRQGLITFHHDQDYNVLRKALYLLHCPNWVLIQIILTMKRCYYLSNRHCYKYTFFVVVLNWEHQMRVLLSLTMAFLSLWEVS